MNTTYTASELRTHLADALSAVASGDVIDVLSYTTPVARIVPAGYELDMLGKITDSEFVNTLLNIASWTGLDSIGALLATHAELTEAGVDPEHPEWDAHLEGRHTIAELVVLNTLGPAAEAVTASGHPLADWLQAIEAAEEILDTDTAEAASLAGTAAGAAHTPASFINRLRQLADEGVYIHMMAEALNEDPLPGDLLAVHGSGLRHHLKELDGEGVRRADAFQLMRSGVHPRSIAAYARAGVGSSAHMIDLHDAGVHPYLLPRAVSEGLPVGEWAAVLGPLREAVHEDLYGRASSPIAADRGLFTLSELSAGGRAHSVLIAWDGWDGMLLDSGTARALAAEGVYPATFINLWQRLKLNLSPVLRQTQNAVATDEEVDQVRSLVQSGAHLVLDRLTTGTARRPRHLRMSWEQMAELGRLAPTAAEARALAEDESAIFWITQLKSWRRFESDAEEFIAEVRTDTEIAALLDNLAASRSRDLWYETDPVRSEAVKLYAGRRVAGSRHSYLHAQTMAEAAGTLARYSRRSGLTADQTAVLTRFATRAQEFVNRLSDVEAFENREARRNTIPAA